MMRWVWRLWHRCRVRRELRDVKTDILVLAELMYEDPDRWDPSRNRVARQQWGDATRRKYILERELEALR